MLRSMTGFGQAVRNVSGTKLQIDIRSVNHRYSEVSIRLPREWLMLEDQLRKLVQQSLKRGRVDVFVTVEREAQLGQQAAVNWPLVESYVSAADQLHERLNLPAEERLRLVDILALPDAVGISEEQTDDVEQISAEMTDCLMEAVQQLTLMREAEGRHLHEELVRRLHTVNELHHQIELEAPAAVEHMRRKLRMRIEELLSESGGYDEQRFVMEVALLAERANIDEELTRLSSHCQQFQTMLESDEPVGRKLDFLIQEMNREVNTIGSKANYSAITNLVVDLKAELEKIREQVQNIE